MVGEYSVADRGGGAPLFLEQKKNIYEIGAFPYLRVWVWVWVWVPPSPPPPPHTHTHTHTMSQGLGSGT